MSITVSHQKEENTGEHHRIQLKNLLRESSDALREAGISGDTIDKTLSPLNGVVEENRQLKFSAESTAFFSCPDFTLAFELSRPLGNGMTVDDHFIVKPLFALREEALDFHLLCLSQGHVGFYHAFPEGLNRVDLGDLPESINEILNEYDFERTLQFRKDTPSGSGVRDARFHGHGGAGDEARLKSKLHEFLDRVDAQVCAYLHEKQGPLVVAAVHHIGLLFQERSQYKEIVPELITGNPLDLNTKQLTDLAVEKVRNQYVAKKRNRYKELLRLKSSELCSTSLEKVILASAQGAVESLFVDVESHIWGEFNARNFQVRIHDERKPSSSDLVNTAAANTYQSDGKVYPIFRNEDIMAEDEISAIFRYPMTNLG